MHMARAHTRILCNIMCISWHSVRGELLGWRWSRPECWSHPGSRNWWCKISSAPLSGLTLRYDGTRMLMTAWQIYSQKTSKSLPPRGSTWQLRSLQSPRHWFADFHCYWLPAANWKSKCWCLLCTVYAHGSLQLYCICPDCPDTQHCRNIESGGITWPAQGFHILGHDGSEVAHGAIMEPFVCAGPLQAWRHWSCRENLCKQPSLHPACESLHPHPATVAVGALFLWAMLPLSLDHSFIILRGLIKQNAKQLNFISFHFHFT